VASRCLGGLRPSGCGFCLGGAGFNPQRYVPAPKLFFDGENRSCRKPASLQANAAHASHTGYGLKGTWPVPGRHPVHHRGPPSLTPWKTQCAQSNLLTAECPSMECRGIDRVRHWSCAGLGAHSGQPGGCSHRTTGTQFTSVAVPPVPVTCTHRSQTMGLFGVKDIGAPEVKFLDRCEIHCSEGVLQVQVRRSRMRVRGAKMIRHRRSPATVNHAG
jgi:hypothetical protein